ncbi:MAG: AAA family ATPase [Rhodospirillaceae bacterium]
MRAQFVKTQNTLEFMSKLAALEQRGASEACLMVVDGDPGLGKSTVVQWWAVQSKAIFLRAKEEWRPAWFLRELLGAMKKQPEHSFERMFRQAVQALGERAAVAQRDGESFAVVIDEVDHFCRDKRMMETIRDLSDMLEIPFILVGMGKVRHNIIRFPAIASRVGQYAVFQPSSLEDTQAMVTGLCEVPVKPDLVEFLYRASRGRSREMKEGIKSIERFGKRNTGKEIGLAEMNGQVLMNDRESGEPIVVRV